MTTQAQIDAAAKAIRKYMGVFTDAEVIAKAAITAATDVGLSPLGHWANAEIKRLKDALAAVEAGPDRAQEYYEAWVKTRDALEKLSVEHRALKAAAAEVIDPKIEQLREEYRAIAESHQKLIAEKYGTAAAEKHPTQAQIDAAELARKIKNMMLALTAAAE